MKKEFKEELYKFISFVKEEKNFSLVRLSDGENWVLSGRYNDEHNINVCNVSWKDDEKYFNARKLLLNASLCEDDNFYIGLPTHGTKEFFDLLKNYTKQREEYLTYACLFMDTNYKYFISDMYPELQKREIIGVFHKKVNLIDSGLNVIKMFGIDYSAYVNSLPIIDEMKQYIAENKIKNKVFLITGGPFANILIYELFKFEKENTYIDIGSALDNKLGFGVTKPFLNNPPNMKYHHWYE